MTVPSSTPPARDSGRDEAREAVATWLHVHDGGVAEEFLDQSYRTRDLYGRYADDLMAVPELRRLLDGAR